MEETFERIYGPEGDWARLFRSSEGYLRTELIRSRTDSQVYLTLDFWRSEESYDHFRQDHAADYKEIDTRCESLTEAETHLGKFTPAKQT